METGSGTKPTAVLVLTPEAIVCRVTSYVVLEASVGAESVLRPVA